MSDAAAEILPPAQTVAIAYARKGKEKLRAFFALDMHCAGLVRRTSEPMLAQMRLAWWREMLSLPPEKRPSGEPLLERARAWGDETASLAEAVSAWEHLVGGEPLEPEAAMRFAEARAQGFAGFARLIGCESEVAAATAAGVRWALADLASHLSEPREREAVLRTSQQAGFPPPLSRGLRPLAVLGGLARRSLARGGAPLLADRASALVAFRLGMLGR